MTPGALLGGKYVLTRSIGEGAMGVVWAAVNRDTGREVALKLILRSSDELRLRLRREARSAGKLQHRNILEVYDVGETAEGDPFLVMPLLTGETLSARLTREGPLDQETAARIGRDVARALSVAHAAGVIHRDLKPANIFLHHEVDSETGPVVKVLDFGVSKNLEANDGVATVVGGLVGSPAYMSPEQARGDRDLDHRSDLWALGVVLFEMLTGERPFSGGPYQLLPQVIEGVIPVVSDRAPSVHPALSAIVAGCLVRDRDKRIPSASTLAAALQRFVAPTQVFASVPPAPPSFQLPPPSLPESLPKSLLQPPPQPPRLTDLQPTVAEGIARDDDAEESTRIYVVSSVAPLLGRREPSAAFAEPPRAPRFGAPPLSPAAVAAPGPHAEAAFANTAPPRREATWTSSPDLSRGSSAPANPRERGMLPLPNGSQGTSQAFPPHLRHAADTSTAPLLRVPPRSARPGALRALEAFQGMGERRRVALAVLLGVLVGVAGLMVFVRARPLVPSPAAGAATSAAPTSLTVPLEPSLTGDAGAADGKPRAPDAAAHDASDEGARAPGSTAPAAPAAHE